MTIFKVYISNCILFNTQIQCDQDLTVAYVTANKPISVLGGAVWTSVLDVYMGDHLAEHIPPVTSWGSEFYALPIATRITGDVFRVLGRYC